MFKVCCLQSIHFLFGLELFFTLSLIVFYSKQKYVFQNFLLFLFNFLFPFPVWIKDNSNKLLVTFLFIVKMSSTNFHLNAWNRKIFRWEDVPRCPSFSPGVNFINVLQAAFTCANPESAKRHSSCQSFLHFWNLWVKSCL